MTFRSLLLSSAALALTAPTTLAAQEGYDLGELILSASLTPLSQSVYGRSVSVLTAEEIEKRGFTTIEDAVRSMAGVSVTSTGESLTALRVRGGEANHLLVLVDGVELNHPSEGAYSFSGLVVAEIDSIELLRGPQSALYGSNAMSGVLSITTKGATRDGFSGNATLNVGSFSTQSGEVNIYHQADASKLAFSLSKINSDGEDLSRTEGGDTEFNNRLVLSTKFEFEASDTLSFGFGLRKIEQEHGYDDTSSGSGVTAETYIVDGNDESEREETFAHIWSEYEALDGRFVAKLDSGLSVVDQMWGTYLSESMRRSTKLALSYALDRNALSLSDHKISGLIEKEEEQYQNTFSGLGARTTKSVAIEYQGAFSGGLDVQLGARFDDNEVFDNTTSWNAAVSYAVPNTDIRLRGSLGTAVVKPTMLELYGYEPGIYEGNADLIPEESESYEVGFDLGFAAGAGQLSFTAFKQEIENRIVGAGSSSVNLEGTSKVKGVEFEVDYGFENGLDLGLAYTLLNGVYSDEAGSLSKMTRRPEHELVLNASAVAFGGNGQISASLRYVDGLYDTNRANSEIEKMPKFVTFDIAAQYDLGSDVTLEGKVTNLFDRSYQEAWGYYAPSRAIYAGLRTSF